MEKVVSRGIKIDLHIHSEYSKAKDGKKVDYLDEEGEIILDNTNFYATSGGQIHDLSLIHI